jgi:hypothetical protein
VKKYGLRGAYISGIVHLATGNALVYKDELDAAIEQFDAALNFFALTRNNSLVADVLNNIGGAYGQRKTTSTRKSTSARRSPENSQMLTGHIPRWHLIMSTSDWHV